MPGRNDARCAIRAPDTATASVPPTTQGCRIRNSP
jgi:hypothetical protein